MEWIARLNLETREMKFAMVGVLVVLVSISLKAQTTRPLDSLNAKRSGKGSHLIHRKPSSSDAASNRSLRAENARLRRELKAMRHELAKVKAYLKHSVDVSGSLATENARLGQPSHHSNVNK